MAQVHQTPHEDLNIWSGMKETGHGSGLVCIDCLMVFLCLLTSLVLRSKRLEVPSILQGLHLLTNSATEKTDEIQAMQLEF